MPLLDSYWSGGALRWETAMVRIGELLPLESLGVPMLCPHNRPEADPSQW